MIGTRMARRLAMASVLCIFAMALPACQSAQGLHWGWHRTDGGDSQSQSLRPVYDQPGSRTFYPGGYAGTDYAASSPRSRRVPYTRIPVASPAPEVSANQGGWGAP